MRRKELDACGVWTEPGVGCLLCLLNDLKEPVIQVLDVPRRSSGSQASQHADAPGIDVGSRRLVGDDPKTRQEVIKLGVHFMPQCGFEEGLDPGPEGVASRRAIPDEGGGG